MTVTYQLSDKRGDAILLVKAEGPGDQIDAIYAGFASAVQDAGLEESLARFGQGLVQAVSAAQPLVQAPAEEPWGNPPVPPMVPSVAQTIPQQPQYQQPAPAAAPAGPPAAAAPFCQHGQKTFLSRTNAQTGKPWKAWACPADRNDPTKCGLDFIRG